VLGLFNKDKNKLVYDKKLISKFHKDHKKLIEIIKSTHEAIEANNIKKSKKYLIKLRMAILEHFMEEDIKLYWYLKRYYKEDSNKLNTVEMFKSTIKDIQRDVLSFLSKYSKEDAELDAKFKEKFIAIVKEFETRIKTEESKLYTLYIK